MSRELLKRAASILHDHFDGVNWVLPLLDDIDEYLAQPDPEPVAWMIENHPTESTFANFKDNFNSHFEHIGCKVTPLYTPPPDQSERIAELEQRIKELEEESRCDDEENQFLEIEIHKLEQQLALQAKREPLSGDAIRQLYRTAFPRGPYVFTEDAVVFARAIEAAHGITGSE